MPAGTKYLIEEGMLGDTLINKDMDDDGIPDHYCFSVTNLFLHSVHPLSWFKKISIVVDHEPVDSRDVFFVIRGQWINIDKMKTINEIYWTIAEEAEICISMKGGINPGKHKIQFSLVTSSFTDTRFLDLKGLWNDRNCILEKEMKTE